MSNITASLVKELRERTGLGMMECKKALVDANGDIELAIDQLRKSSGLKAAKKAGRTAAEGVVVTRVSADGQSGLLLEVNSETDFVARDENFLGFVNAAADQALAERHTAVDALLAAGVESAREALVQKIGENISVRRVLWQEGGPEHRVCGYVHGGRIGVLVLLKGGNDDLGRDIAMHVAAINPQYVAPADVAEDLLDREREVVRAQAESSGKPAAIIEKMIEGRIKKFLAEVSLTEQPFVKDPDVRVSDFLAKAQAEVVSFVRFEVGEGIEKEEVDFAAEVAAQAGLNR